MDLIERCILRGADSFVPKPLQLGVVKAIWQYCLMKSPHEFNRMLGRSSPGSPRSLEVHQAPSGVAPPMQVQGPLAVAANSKAAARRPLSAPLVRRRCHSGRRRRVRVGTARQRCLVGSRR